MCKFIIIINLFNSVIFIGKNEYCIYTMLHSVNNNVTIILI